MPAKKRVNKKKAIKSTKKALQKKKTSKPKNKSKVRNSTKRKTSKKAVKKVPVKPKKKTTKKVSKKSTTRKTKTVKKKIVKKTQPITKRTVVQKIIKEDNSANDEKFNLLLEELKSLKQNNNELANQIQKIQSDNKNQKETNIITAEKGKGNSSKEELMSQLKNLLSKNKELSENKELTENKEIFEKEKPDKAIEVKESIEENVRENSFNKPLIKKEEISKPPTITEIKKEEFQTNRKRGVVTAEEALEYSKLLKELINEINKVFIGQEKVVEGVILSLICDAHTLLEGVPGLAKSLLIEVLGKTISGTTFERIQFLPDLLPSDIIGGQIFNPKTAQFVTHKGPIFANFVLADEINRAPPKTHAAVMEAMQEKKINIENDEFILDRPFLVLATQNPLENKGTYQLPEAVLDRFMFKVILDYPKRSDELKIITDNATTKKNLQKKIRSVMDKDKLLEIQQKVKKVYISDKIREYILDLVEATRGINKEIQGVKFLKYGAGVRASIYLGIGAKAKALFNGRNYVLPDDVYAVIPDIFRHRLSLNYRGKAHNISTDKIIEEILKKVNAI